LSCAYGVKTVSGHLLVGPTWGSLSGWHQCRECLRQAMFVLWIEHCFSTSLSRPHLGCSSRVADCINAGSAEGQGLCLQPKLLGCVSTALSLCVGPTGGQMDWPPLPIMSYNLFLHRTWGKRRRPFLLGFALTPRSAFGA